NRDCINRIRLAFKTCGRRARICERVHTYAEPSDAVAAAYSNQTEEQDDGQRDCERFAGHGREHAEIEHYDCRYERPDNQNESTLRYQVGLARLVTQFRNLSHDEMHR